MLMMFIPKFSLKKIKGEGDIVIAIMLLSPHKPLDGNQLNLVCELFT